MMIIISIILIVFMICTFDLIKNIFNFLSWSPWSCRSLIYYVAYILHSVSHVIGIRRHMVRRFVVVQVGPKLKSIASMSGQKIQNLIDFRLEANFVGAYLHRSCLWFSLCLLRVVGGVETVVRSDVPECREVERVCKPTCGVASRQILNFIK